MKKGRAFRATVCTGRASMQRTERGPLAVTNISAACLLSALQKSCEATLGNSSPFSLILKKRVGNSGASWDEVSCTLVHHPHRPVCIFTDTHRSPWPQGCCPASPETSGSQECEEGSVEVVDHFKLPLTTLPDEPSTRRPLWHWLHEEC